MWLKRLNSTARLKKFNRPLRLIGKISTAFQPWLKSTVSTALQPRPEMSDVLTKGIQPNKKEPRPYEHISNTTATQYSYYASLTLHSLIFWPLSPKTNKRATAYTRYPPWYQKETRSQTESQQHTPLTQILDTVAFNSLV